MKVALDAQLLFEQQKTGIGWNARMMIDQLVQFPEMEIVLNCFRPYDKKYAEQLLVWYRAKGCRVNQNNWITARVYNHLERIFPFPYRLVFGREANITQFFNYTIPFGVSGKSVTFVYDMAYMACPETMAWRTSRWLHKNMEKYSQRASVILTISEFSSREIQHYLHVPPEKIRVIYCGTDLTHYYPRTQEEIQSIKERIGIPGKYILYLGTLEPRKNIETLIRAYRILKKDRAGVPRLVIAGKKGWMYDSIFELVKDYGLTRDVIFTGYVDEADVPALLSGAEMFAFPSLYEGFGIPPLEAMACGTPVITSDVSSLPEVVGDAGIMIPPKDHAALAEKMRLLLENAELSAKYRAAGLERAGKFTWEAAAAQLIQVYRELEG